MKLEHEAPEPSKIDDVENANHNNLDETLSFLNSLPEVVKPEPKRSVLDEHLAFLDNLRKAPHASVAVDAVIEPEPMQEAETPAKTAPRTNEAREVVPHKTERPKPKKKKSSQLMKEEKNRREKERAEAKRRERRKAEQQQEKVTQEEPPSEAKRKPSFFGKLLGA
jgi:hypothetical protein